MTAPADCAICCPGGWSPNVDQVPDEDCPTHGRPRQVVGKCGTCGAVTNELPCRSCCYSRVRGRVCQLCDHKNCESCPDCSPEVPE